MSLEKTLSRINNWSRLRRKAGLRELFDCFKKDGILLTSFGEDSGAIRFGKDYLLMSADGIMTGLLLKDSYFAGVSAVIVSVNDIQAMGGRAIGIVNVIAGNKRYAKRLMDGMRFAADRMGIYILGGHFHPSGGQVHLSVAALGSARRLIYSNTAKKGDDILVAIDISGELRHLGILALDSFTKKPKRKIQEVLNVMPELANRRLLTSAKDISNAGIIGTIGIMLELSKRGGIVNSEEIPWNGEIPLSEWFKIYPSYGFVMTCHPDNTRKVISTFNHAGIKCSRIGAVADGSSCYVKWQGKVHRVFDWSKRSLL